MFVEETERSLDGTDSMGAAASSVCIEIVHFIDLNFTGDFLRFFRGFFDRFWVSYRQYQRNSQRNQFPLH